MKSARSDHWTRTVLTIIELWLNEGLKPRYIPRDLIWDTPVPLQGYTCDVTLSQDSTILNASLIAHRLFLQEFHIH